MNNLNLIHIGSELLLLCSVVFYFYRQNKLINNELTIIKEENENMKNIIKNLQDNIQYLGNIVMEHKKLLDNSSSNKPNKSTSSSNKPNKSTYSSNKPTYSSNKPNKSTYSSNQKDTNTNNHIKNDSLNTTMHEGMNIKFNKKELDDLDDNDLDNIIEEEENLYFNNNVVTDSD